MPNKKPISKPKKEYNCDRCKDYDKQGHNYCRVCNWHFTKGTHQRTKVLVSYFTDDKYCGHCDQKRHTGECESKNVHK